MEQNENTLSVLKIAPGQYPQQVEIDGMEYGSARWGTPKDIEPFMAPKFADNIILTKTERLMMSNRPPDPKNARNKNVLVVGGSGSGKTRFFIKPNLLQCDSKNFPVSFVVTDPKGSIGVECGEALLKHGYKLKFFNTINFSKSIRSREISACLVLQTRSQLKAIYKDNADTIVGNMDSQIFLGGSEPTTLKDLAEALGKETIDSYNNSDTRGNSPSYGTNYQKLGHELMSRDELAVLDGGKCILQLRGVRPFLSDKYDLTQHPNYKLTSDANPKNALDIEKYLSHKEKIHSDDQFVLVDVDSLPPA
ncbi:TraM recognition domain-containing protein [Faecalibacterium sp. CLA-JM-H7B]|uniref:TraM recognition domain-containing protein n=1 Tax=Faecalibacterium faecis TaxID=3133157 RepID=A0ABV1BLP6_9FIRM